MKNFTMSLLLGTTMFSLLFTSCKKELNDPIVQLTGNGTTLSADSTKILTYEDSTVVLSNFQTVSVPDSVTVVNGNGTSKELNQAETIYLKAMKDSLIAKGYQIVALNENPDLVLNVTRVIGTSDSFIDNNSYWMNYNSFYDPSIYGATGATYTTNFSPVAFVGDGDLSFELLDLKDASANNNTIDVVWQGIIETNAIISNYNIANTEFKYLLNKSGSLFQ